MTIRSTRSGVWQCGDLTAQVTIQRPSVRDVIAHDGDVARADGAYQSLGVTLSMLERLVVSVGSVQRGSEPPCAPSVADLLDALDPMEVRSLLTWAIEPPSPPSAA